ncbi:hypothetical protein BABINDRAFT_163888 [Babjeviella inositovora NRRL Y-12698]|uniref:Uncharacterized protein n=1 Tax=Babjeviella inositovora NRRL Y-12698 TaxID=984486 RepID=A0A1E3QIU1_9ASCO|nr:uncharacterized protein BABINDRAFT_163888 [Babjeviella inositovora NRRL Y-12698]ODQ76982.1 hypothetical protein BABINDRAFT_163888 [Babjeviella inositovora NRRL Y-12698]
MEHSGRFGWVESSPSSAARHVMGEFAAEHKLLTAGILASSFPKIGGGRPIKGWPAIFD